MKYVDWSHTSRLTDEWFEWHSLHLTREERDSVFLSSNDAAQCWKRDGGEWKRYSGGHVFKKHIDEWMRAQAGHSIGEHWDVDRVFYPDEERPVLPRGRGTHWVECGRVLYPLHSYGWQTGSSNEPGHAAHIAFKDKKVATLFAMLWL